MGMTLEQVFTTIAVNFGSFIVGVGLVWAFCWWAMKNDRAKRSRGGE